MLMPVYGALLVAAGCGNTAPHSIAVGASSFAHLCDAHHAQIVGLVTCKRVPGVLA